MWFALGFIAGTLYTYLIPTIKWIIKRQQTRLQRVADFNDEVMGKY